MGLVASLISTSANAGALVTVWHGTDLNSANWLATKGVDFERMLAINAYANTFCVSTNPKIAWGYSDLNCAVRTSNGIRALVGWQVAPSQLWPLLAATPPLAFEVIEDEAIEFYPESFPMLNTMLITPTVLTQDTIWTVGLS